MLVLIYNKDFLTTPRHKKVHTGIIMGVALHYLVTWIDILIDRRVKKLSDKKPGSITQKVIWVCMLKRPHELGVSAENKAAFALWGKFSSVLEEIILDGFEDRHCILSIEVD